MYTVLVKVIFGTICIWVGVLMLFGCLAIQRCVLLQKERCSCSTIGNANAHQFQYMVDGCLYQKSLSFGSRKTGCICVMYNPDDIWDSYVSGDWQGWKEFHHGLRMIAVILLVFGCYFSYF